MTPQAIRKRNLTRLRRLGFKVASSLPVERGTRRLRAPIEIASRLMALDALTCWVSDLDTEAARVRAYAKRGRLGKWMTAGEKRIFALPRPRANRLHVDTIGWRFENMWPLAWALGFAKVPGCDGKMIGGATIRALVLEFLPGLKFGPTDLVSRAKPRSLDDVAALEDLFYCAHNAARSAQLGGKTVPRGFDPVAGGGVIHERRHALGWCLADDDWDDVDLST